MVQRPHYDAVILDVDGTLVDSNDAHAHAWIEAFAERGYRPAFADVRQLIGMGGDKLVVAAVGRTEDHPTLHGLADRRGAIFEDRWLAHVRPLPGARDLVLRLRRLGLRLAIASSARAEELQPLLAIAGVDDLIPTQTTSSDVERSKPDPDLIVAALRRLGSAAAATVMVGDTPYDIAAAHAAGVATIALRSGGWPIEALAGALAVYDDPADLLANLDDSPLGAAAA